MATVMLLMTARPGLADDINISTFRPSLHAGDTLAIRTANMPDKWGWGVGAWLDYGYKPLAIEDGPDLVTHLFLARLYGQLSFTDWLSVGLEVPLAVVNGPGATNFALSDVRLGLKARILGGNGRGFGLALSQDLTFPTATKDIYVGDELVTGTTNVILDYSKSGWNVALNLGFRLKKPVDFVVNGLPVHTSGHQLLLGAGLVAPLVCGKLEALGTIEFRTALTNPFKSEYDNQIDLLAGLRGHVNGVVLTAAAGGSPLKGYGGPAVQGVLQIGYEGKPVGKGCYVAPVRVDTDGDGLFDDEDDCPTEPGPVATRGCPDRDGDGIPDRDDRCPDVPGTRALQGCPDRDGDGIADIDDRCPDDPGKAEFQGCPDRDGDGIPDIADECPDEPGIPELKGCPRKAVLTEKSIDIIDMVFFDTDKSVLRPDSLSVLDQVVALLKDNPGVLKVRVEGHTDDTGTEVHNKGLSHRRANAVRQYLIRKGIKAKRLESKGFGQFQPIVPNDTDANRARNRRVEFDIVERAPAD
jgi:outer membrane protein OmpA-like peptidoglycan-associated protein